MCTACRTSLPFDPSTVHTTSALSQSDHGSLQILFTFFFFCFFCCVGLSVLASATATRLPPNGHGDADKGIARMSFLVKRHTFGSLLSKIGIQYANSHWDELDGPHHDVAKMRKFIEEGQILSTHAMRWHANCTFAPPQDPGNTAPYESWLTRMDSEPRTAKESCVSSESNFIVIDTD